MDSLPRGGRGGGRGGGHDRARSEGDLRTASLRRASRSQLRRHPSQATMWTTTVPQSMTAQTLGTRHAPTRHALRHSRMMVLSRVGAVPRKYLPPVIERYRLGTALAVAHLALGLAMSAVAAWVMVWAPDMAARDAAHYSGLMLIVSGWCGLLLMTCCRYHYPGTTQAGCVFPVKTKHIVLSVLTSLVSLVCCVLAFAFHSLHLFLLYEAVPWCAERPLQPHALEHSWMASLVAHASCVCDTSPAAAASAAWRLTDGRSLVYVGLQCADVKRKLPLLLIAESVANFVGVFVAAWFFGLVVTSRHHRTFASWRRRSKRGAGAGGDAADGGLNSLERQAMI